MPSIGKMITVDRVDSPRDRKEFLSFPLRLYRGCPYFVPPLYGDEKKIFKKDFVYRDTCETVCFLARDEKGRTVGRISGILQKAANEKNREKRVRFTRFDAIEDRRVASLLFSAVESWAKRKGMDTVCGPLGYSDLEREGLLIDGFDRLSTFEEQYNYPYYADLIESCGYKKEVDWFESVIRAPSKEEIEKTGRIASLLQARYRLHFGQAKNTSDFLEKYKDGFFDLIDRSYGNIYGTVPFTEGMKKMMIDSFRLIIDLRFVAVILDENERPVAFGICFPSIAKAVQKSKGRLTPNAVVRILKEKKNPRHIDLGLIGVDPDWLNRGVSVLLMYELMKMLALPGIESAETNLNLEDNYDIRNMWKRFGQEEHKKRRAYVKRL